MATDNKDARSHVNFTNRKTPKTAQNRPAEGTTRVVFKSVLHNPLQVQWPPVSQATQSKMLNAVCEFVRSIGPYYVDRRRKDRTTASNKPHRRKGRSKDTLSAASLPPSSAEISKASCPPQVQSGVRKKRKRDDDGDVQPAVQCEPSEEKRAVKRARVESNGGDEGMAEETDDIPDTAAMDIIADPPAALPVEVPPLLAFLTIGINEVTRQLEALTLSRRTSLAAASHRGSSAAVPDQVSTSLLAVQHMAGPTDLTAPKTLRLILVCRYDVDPPILVSHLPLLVASYNSLLPPSSLDSSAILLVTLPKRAEHALAESLGLRRAAVVGFDAATPSLTTLLDCLGTDVKPLTASWLGNAKTIEFIPTHVKQVKTTAPKDMRRAKEERAAGRSAAKAKRRESKGAKGKAVEAPQLRVKEP